MWNVLYPSPVTRVMFTVQTRSGRTKRQQEMSGPRMLRGRRRRNCHPAESCNLAGGKAGQRIADARIKRVDLNRPY